MIKVVQIETRHGEAYLNVEYSLVTGSGTKTVKINAGDIADRLLTLKKIVGRELTAQDLSEVLTAYVKELRLGSQKLGKEIDWETLVGVDLEA
jgi:hypothetical protein